MKHSAKVGDVFLVPIDADRVGIGQIAGDWRGELYMVFFEKIYHGNDVDPLDVVRLDIVLAALSLDAKLYNKAWSIIGNVLDNIALIAQPAYKVDDGGVAFIETRDRTMTRPASPAESEMLQYRTVVAPVRLERALKAIYGVGEWEERFDNLRYDYAIRSSELVKSAL